MRKATGIVIALAILACAGARQASATVLGFDITGAYYMPRDSRWTGVGVDVAVNANISKDLIMGYRVEELYVQGNDNAALPGAAPVLTTANSQITFQGVQGWYTLTRAMEDRLSADLGLWFGAAFTNNFQTTGAGPAPAAGAAKQLTSPFIEPQTRVNYTSHLGAVEAKFWAGIGYRFVRNWNDPHPFGGVAGPPAGLDRTLTDFDGLDWQAGFGLMF